MKRKNLFALCLTAIVATALYGMGREDESPDPDLAALQIGSPGQRTQQAGRLPLATLNRTTPNRAIMPIEGEEPRPGTPLRTTPGTANQLNTATIEDIILELRRRVAAGDMTPTQLTRELRFLFPERVPTPRSDRENTGPQSPNTGSASRNANQN